MSKIDELKDELVRHMVPNLDDEHANASAQIYSEMLVDKIEALVRAVARQETTDHFKRIQKKGQRAMNQKRNYGNKGKVRQEIR